MLYPFIGSIGAIWIAITPPFVRHTKAIGAFKVLIGIALWHRTVFLIAIIAAIVIAIATPTLLDAFAICACEFVGAAGFICEKSVRIPKSIRNLSTDFGEYKTISGDQCEYLLQNASSDLSAQSSFWSQTHPIGMHDPSPLLHVNSSAEHTLFSAISKNI